MSKPLVLNVYSLWTSAGGSVHCSAFQMDGFPLDVDVCVEEKRFTDAELAAESYRQMVRACAESGLNVKVGADGNFVAVPGDGLVFGPIRREAAQLGDIKRFATLPHYDEVTA